MIKSCRRANRSPRLSLGPGWSESWPLMKETATPEAEQLLKRSQRNEQYSDQEWHGLVGSRWSPSSWWNRTLRFNENKVVQLRDTHDNYWKSLPWHLRWLNQHSIHRSKEIASQGCHIQTLQAMASGTDSLRSSNLFRQQYISEWIYKMLLRPRHVHTPWAEDTQRPGWSIVFSRKSPQEIACWMGPCQRCRKFPKTTRLTTASNDRRPISCETQSRLRIYKEPKQGLQCRFQDWRPSHRTTQRIRMQSTALRCFENFAQN